MRTSWLVAMTVGAQLAAAATPQAAAPSSARIPFVKGLTTVRIATSSQGDYETLRTVTEVTDKGYRTVTSGEAPSDSGAGLIPVNLTRAVRAIDQLHSRNVRIAWHSSDRENMTGNAPGLSCDIFNELRTTGKATINYIDVNAMFGIASSHSLPGTVSVVDRKPFTVLVNRQKVAMPALHVAGDVGGEPFDFRVLDDPDNPLMLSAIFGETDAQVTAIEFTPSAPALEQTLATTEVLELSGIYFSFASATLRPESDAVLGELASVLKDHPDWRFRIDGHTDSVGSDAANLDLSKRRAAAVRAALVDRFGVSGPQLSTGGFGETQPKESNDTELGRAHNRRVELVRLDASVASKPKVAHAAPVVAGSACRFGGAT